MKKEQLKTIIRECINEVLTEPVQRPHTIGNLMNEGIFKDIPTITLSETKLRSLENDSIVTENAWEDN